MAQVDRRWGHRAAVATAVMALVATGCGNGGETEQPATPGTGTETGTEPADSGEAVTLTITANAIEGGKNEAEALWIQDYIIPEFEAQQQGAGQQVSVEFVARGVDDEDYKAQQALDLSSGAGSDIIAIDGIWVGEFAQAEFIEPLEDVVGDAAASWDGWDQIPDAVEANMSFEGQRYGVPSGTDGRILYYNKDLFDQAGLPTEWEPTSWADVLDTARTLQDALPEVTPLQINAGTTMGEATTMQGILPLLAGTGERVHEEQTSLWLGASQGLQDVLGFYQTVYVDEGLGNDELQLRQDGRDRSFQEFSEGEIAILLEGDFFWRAVIEPVNGTAPMENRDEVVGWAKIPAMEPGGGLNGQDFVSMSGGGGRVLNPNTEHPELAWELLAFMNSRDAVTEFVGGQIRITQRDDVNAENLAGDPLMTFVAEEVLPLTAFRPGFAEYPQVSVALQEASEAVVTGTPPADAAAAYAQAVGEIVGADNVGS